MNKRKFDFLQGLNGLGLGNTEDHFRLIARYHGIHLHSKAKKTPREEAKRLLRLDVKLEMLGNLRSKYISEIAAWKAVAPEKKAPTEPRLGGVHVVPKDYSGFPPQKRSRAWYAANKGKKKPGLTPRQIVFTTPEEYCATAEETPAKLVPLKRQ